MIMEKQKNVVNLVNSHQGVLWNQHLNWMMQHRGNIIWMIFEADELVEYLNSFVAHCVEYRAGVRQRKKMTTQEAELDIMNNLLDQFTHQEVGLSFEQMLEIKEYIQTLEENEITVEV
jgi:hypothetical protein